MLTVFLGWVDTRGDGIRVYLGLVGIVVASTIAFIRGRLIDAHAERRRTQRLINVALMRVRRLRERLRLVREAIKNLSDGRSSGTAMTSDDVVDHCVRYLLDAVRAAETAPSFDDFIDNEEDLGVASTVDAVFQSVRSYCDLNSNAPDRHVKRHFAVLGLLGRAGQEVIAGQILSLDAAADHPVARSKAL